MASIFFKSAIVRPTRRGRLRTSIQMIDLTETRMVQSIILVICPTWSPMHPATRRSTQPWITYRSGSECTVTLASLTTLSDMQLPSIETAMTFKPNLMETLVR